MISKTNSLILSLQTFSLCFLSFSYSTLSLHTFTPLFCSTLSDHSLASLSQHVPFPLSLPTLSHHSHPSLTSLCCPTFTVSHAVLTSLSPHSLPHYLSPYFHTTFPPHPLSLSIDPPLYIPTLTPILSHPTLTLHSTAYYMKSKY